MKKFSLLIPTRNGAKYLPFAIRSVLSQPYDNVELIVSVNHSTDDTLELLKSFSDPRLKVIVPPVPLSMAKHWEWMLRQASGEWISIIGDDDAVMPYFFEETNKILDRFPETRALSCKGAYFFWQGAEVLYGPAAVRYEFGNAAKKMNAKWALLKALAGMIDFSELPKLYTNGLIHHSVIEAILAKSNGQFYYEMTPDVYSAVAVSTTVSDYLQVDLPLFWVGSSPKSVGMSASLSKKDRSENAENAKVREFETMACADRLTVSQQIGMALWRQSISAFFVLSALRNLPYKVPFFQGNWIEYLTFGSVYRKAKKDGFSLRKDYQEQCSYLGLRSPLLVMTTVLLRIAALVLAWLGKVQRLINKLKPRLPKQGRKLHSNDKALFPTIDTASLEAVDIYRQFTKKS